MPKIIGIARRRQMSAVNKRAVSRMKGIPAYQAAPIKPSEKDLLLAELPILATIDKAFTRRL